MNGITWFEAHGSMVIVACPAGRSNTSDFVPPTPTIVTVLPSTITAGDAPAPGETPVPPEAPPPALEDCPKSSGMGVHAAITTASSRPAPTPLSLATLGPPLCAGPRSATLRRLRVDRVAQPVTDEVHAQHHRGDRDGRRDPLPGQCIQDDGADRLGDQIAP